VTKVSAVDDDDGDSGLVHYILGNAPYHKFSSELDGDISENTDYGRSREKSRRQKVKNGRYGGDGRGRGRKRPTSIASRQIEYADKYSNQTEERRSYEIPESEVRNSQATYDGDCVGRVNVDKDSGVVTVVGLIDFEYSAVINCRLLAVDSGSQPKTGD